MNIHEFGADKNKIIVLIHPSLVMWDYFEYILSILKEEYHIIVPALTFDIYGTVRLALGFTSMI